MGVLSVSLVMMKMIVGMKIRIITFLTVFGCDILGCSRDSGMSFTMQLQQ